MSIVVYLGIPSGRPVVPGDTERCAVTLAAALGEHHAVDFVTPSTSGSSVLLRS